ncbi:hypothetical protein J3U21_08545, partial [Gilliamella sp. B2776]|uniref:hypothetical protein n=1 Tax=unclassified Gilliamella TaxID=2685620 RepID=UPI002269B326
SEVKRRSADGSVGITHVRVGSRQTFKYIESPAGMLGFFAYRNYKLLIRLFESRLLAHLPIPNIYLVNCYN